MEAMDLTLSLEHLAERIQSARERVVLAIPGLHPPVLEALKVAHEHLGRRTVVILDTAEQVFRLGFGTADALTCLQERRVPTLRKEGLRLGLALVDEDAWMFMPAALLVEADHPGTGPRWNACPVPETLALAYLRSLAESPELEYGLKGHLAQEPDANLAVPVSVDEVKVVQEQLKAAPPMDFDLHRQVVVFQAYVRYAELTFHGSAPGAVRARIPARLLPQGADPELEAQLQTSVAMFHDQVVKQIKALADKVEGLRKKYLKPLGDPYGNVILAREAPLLKEEVAALKETIRAQHLDMARLMEADRRLTLERLISVCVDHLLLYPPGAAELKASRHFMDSDRKANLTIWVAGELDRILPRAYAVAGKLRLVLIFKDFTFESLQEQDVFTRLKEVFPDEDWDIPMEKARAALESRKVKGKL